MLSSFLYTYGYLAILIGTLFEGETVLILGGIAAHLGYLKLPWVIVTAFVGSYTGGQLFFYLGRRRREEVIKKFPFWAHRIDKARESLDKHGTVLVLIFPFLYGLRTVTPFVIGMSPIRARKFILLSAVSACVWAVTVGFGGYLFGKTLELIMGDIRHYEIEIMGIILLAGIIIWTIFFFRQRRSQG